MAASIQLAPLGTKIVQISFISRTNVENTISLEQLPGAGYRMPIATMINLWDIYSHMYGKTYTTIESLLDDVAEGWKSWREYTSLPTLTNSEETAIIKAALSQADIHPKRVRHYCGPIIITMDRPEKYEGEFLQIETLAWRPWTQPPTPATSAAISMFSASSAASSPQDMNDLGGVRDETKKQE